MTSETRRTIENLESNYQELDELLFVLGHWIAATGSPTVIAQQVTLDKVFRGSGHDIEANIADKLQSIRELEGVLRSKLTYFEDIAEAAIAKEQ